MKKAIGILLFSAYGLGAQVVISGKVAISGLVAPSTTSSDPAMSSITSSNTQTVFRYTAPDSADCTWEISESPTYLPLIHDLDTTLFSGSNADSRSESYKSGTTRVFVVGKRRAEQATSSRWYSRAEQAITTHYYRRTCSDGPHTGSYTTANVALGNTYNDVFPSDPNAATKPYTSQTGFYAWPEFTKWDPTDSTARAESIVDPHTGILLKRMTLPQDQPYATSPGGDHVFDTASGASWTNPNNVKADDGSAATYSGTGSAFLFVSDTAAYTDALYNLGYPVEYLTLDIKAWCSVGGCTAANATIEACLTLNGTTCWPSNATAKFQELILGTSTSPTITTIGTGCTVPILDCWTPAGYPPLTRVDLKSGGALGWLIRKKSATTDQINIQYVKYALGTSLTMDWPASGSSNLCSSTLTQNSVTGGLGYHCIMTSTGNPMLYWTDHATGTSNYLGLFTTGSSSGADGWISSACTGRRSIAGTTPSANETVYCSTDDNGEALATTLNGAINSSTTSIVVTSGANIVNYKNITIVAEGANNTETVLVTAGGGTANLTVTRGQEGSVASSHASGASANIPKGVILSCSITTTNQAGSLSIGCTNITKASTGKDVATLVSAFTSGDTPAFDKTLFGGGSVVGMQNSKLILESRRSDQDTLAWNIVFDPALVSSAAGCNGGILPGCVVAAMSSWAKAPARWCVNHTPFVAGPTNMVWTAGKYLADFGKAGDGPFTSAITVGSLALASGAIAPGAGLCPAGTLRCDTVTVDGEPCDTSPITSDLRNCPKNGTYSWIQNAIVGDIFTIDSEWIRLANKGASNSWTFQRGYGHRGTSTHAGATVSAYCQSQDFTQEYTNWSWVWDSVNDPHGTNSGGTTVTVAWDFDHPTPNPTQTVGGDAFWDTNCTASGCYAARTTGVIGAAPNVLMAAGPTFASAAGSSQYLVIAEDHPGMLQNPSGNPWLLDGRPLTPTAEISDVATAVSGQLYKLTSTTSDGDNLSAIGGGTLGVINRKKQPTWAYCGTQPLIDISSATATGNPIGTTSADSFKYCTSRKVNECRSGSAVGDIYVNCPNQVVRGAGSYGCASQTATLTTDICIGNSAAYLSAVSQVGFGASNDFTGAMGRKLTSLLSRYKIIDGFWNAQSFYDATWLISRSMYLGGAWPTTVLAKIPPFPSTDSYVRNTFVPVTVTLATVGGTTNGIVRFGYSENGPFGSFYCTSRQEACVANATTVQAIPFQFQLSDGAGAETGITGVSCAAGCSIDLPGISGRVVYLQKVWRNGANATVQTGPIEVAIVP